MSRSALKYFPAPLPEGFDIGLQLLDYAAAAGTEGLWLPSRFAKTGSIDITGTASAFSVSLLGSNALDDPLNQLTLTVGGTVATGHTITGTISSSNLPGGSAKVTYVTNGTDTTTTVATALTAAINASVALDVLGIGASSAAAVITAQFPSVVPQGQSETPSYGVNAANILTISFTSTGSETVTVAGVADGNTIGSAITAVGITALSPIPRWIRARLTALTGSFINAAFAGSA